MNHTIITPPTKMMTSERIREIRKYRELKQTAVAAEMNISQQAYCRLETTAANIKVQTLRKVCQVIKVDVSFLLAYKIPVTEQNMAIFDGLSYAAVCEDYKKLKNKLAIVEDLVLKMPRI